jgi:two-component system response regulator HydG
LTSKRIFTGAILDKIGFLKAKRGTIFLDEIGNHLAKTNSAFTGFKKEKKNKTVGSNKEIGDIRIITATNEDLREAVKKKRRFRKIYTTESMNSPFILLH